MRATSDRWQVTGPVNIRSQLVAAAQALAPVAKENAALEARLLASHAWGMSVEQLVLCGNEARDEAAFAALVARRAKAEPVSQILGQKHFWKACFLVSRDVLTPRADSETMIETLLRLRPDMNAPYRMLDLGTGSGCLVLSALGEYASASGVAVDASAAALVMAERNAAALGLSHRCEMLQSDWCSNLKEKFDIILANPPYIPLSDMAGLDADVQHYEPHSALTDGADGLNCYRAIAQQLYQHANPGALALFEVGAGQAADIAAIGIAAGWQFLTISNDLAGIARVVAFEINPD